MRFRVTFDGCLRAASGKIDDAARAALATAMGELNGLGARNAAIHLNSATGHITISCAVEADKLRDAVQPASDNIQLALFAGQIGTDDWPGPEDPHWRVEFIGQRTEVLQPA